ncbi:right-handed parallel beta-helix repeat-containing protein [Chitinophaga sp. sic0106]|uniref:right-handed parallel beta-helix repeat-containing protein n=1 Tax=Chitinophaga sp. sic0106 TaxID=2854785 RepID=UPI001C476DDE|nr:right-handed parallel beta-helix repeat-containing protein [Chitinophaga sp. sic0106]MBV7529694.1 right-handed parallel beta-helix repeat-containing protein [Chitinophaga sp. sic0106]
MIGRLLLIAVIAGCTAGKPDLTGAVIKPQMTAWYASPQGNDAATGDLKHPLKSISAAVSKMKPGDTLFLRDGSFSEIIVISKSDIVIMAMPQEQPVVDMSGYLVSAGTSILTISGARNVTIAGIDFCNLKSNTPGTEVNGIVVNNGSKNITLRKNKVYNIEHNVAPDQGRGGHGILIIGNTAEVVKDILVEENIIHDTKTGYSENLTINGYVDGFIIRGNTIYNTENIGIDAAGGYAANPTPALNYARNGWITENELYNIDMTRGPIGGVHGHGAIGIYVDGARNIIVERNRVHDADRGIGIVSETDAFPTSHCKVRNNFVYNCWRTGIYLGGYLNYTSGGTRNCYVVNNTLFMNNREPGAFSEIEGELRMTELCFDNVVMNNLVYARPVDVFFHKYTSTGSGNVVNHNLYYTTGSPQWIWNGVPYTTMAIWQAGAGQDNAAVYGMNPMLVNTTTPDLHLQPGSPAGDGAYMLHDSIVGTLDIDGHARKSGGRLTIGAHQL